MGEKNNRTPLHLLTETLAEMTDRAVQAERMLEAAQKDAETWYKCYTGMAEKVKEAEAKLTAEIEEHAKTKDALREALDLAAERSKVAAAKSKKKGA